MKAHAIGRRGASQAPDLAERQPRGVVDQFDHGRLERVFRQQPVGGFGNLVCRGAGGCGCHALGAEVAAAVWQRREHVAPLASRRRPVSPALGAEQVAHEVGFVVHVDQPIGQVSLGQAATDQFAERGFRGPMRLLIILVAAPPGPGELEAAPPRVDGTAAFEASRASTASVTSFSSRSSPATNWPGQSAIQGGRSGPGVRPPMPAAR